MLKVHEITKRFGDRLVLDALRFEVQRGEVVGLLGPNGAGKTTALRIVAGFLAPTAGQVTINGFDVAKAPLEAKRSLGYLPEGAPCYLDLRAGEYLRLRARLKGVAWRTRRRHVDEAAERAGIRALLGRPIELLSRGQRQSLGICDALLGWPPLLVLDEPTAGLDPNQALAVKRLLRELAERHAVLLSTHLLSEVEAACTRALILHEGRLVREESLARIAFGALDAIDCELIGPGQSIEGALSRLAGVTRVTWRDLGGGAHAFRLHVQGGKDLREAIGRQALRAGWVVRELRPAGQTLEDVFVGTTTGLETGDQPTTTSSGQTALDPAWRARLLASRPGGASAAAAGAAEGAGASAARAEGPPLGQGPLRGDRS